jgi:hypothetical protein
MTDLITIEQVPIARVGDWPAAGGSGVIEASDIASMVAASHDPEIQAAGPIRGWLGHNGAMNEWGEPVARDPLNTADPAIGTVQNLTASDDGQTLLADLVDIPEIVAVFWPQRSIETVHGVVTSNGTRYQTVLTGMAYLGRSDPAVGGMPDLLDAMQGSTSGALAAAGVRFDGTPSLMSALPRDISAPADDQTVARVTRRALAQAAHTDLARTGDTPAAAAAQPTEQQMPQSTTPPAENTPAADDDHGQDDPNAVIPGENEQEENEERDAPASNGEQPAAPAAGGDTVTVDRATFTAMQEQLTELTADREARQEREHAEARAQLLASGVTSGRFAEARRDHYGRLFDADPEGTRTLVESLEPGLVPTAGSRLSAGASAAPTAGDIVIKADEPLPAGLSLLTTRDRERHTGAAR